MGGATNSLRGWEPPFGRYLALYLIGIGLLLFLGFRDPESWMSMQDRGNFQLVQSAVLAVPLIAVLLMIRNTTGDERAFWVLVVGVAFFLFWRETDVDNQFFDARAFSWKYLAKDDVPLHVKLLLGIPSITLATLYAAFVLRRIPLLLREVRSRIVPQTIFWTAVTLGALLLSQIWDRARILEDHIGFRLPASHDDSYSEEAMEMAGELAFAFLVLTVRYMSKRTGRGGKAGRES